MAGAMIPGKHWNESQFQVTDRSVYVKNQNRTLAAGTLLHSLCGVSALAMVESAHAQTYLNTIALFERMAPVGRTDLDGQTTMANIELQARADGYTKTVRLNWTGAGYPQATWESFLTKHLLAGAAVIIETNNGQALKDYIRGTGEDATDLQRHFFTALGYNAGGYSPTFGRSVPFGFICTDSCNNAVNPVVNGARTRILGDKSTGILFYYPATVVAQTRPGALLAIYPKAVSKPAPAPAPQPQPAPAPAPQPTSTPQPATSYTVTYTADELRAFESLLARLPKP